MKTPKVNVTPIILIFMMIGLTAQSFAQSDKITMEQAVEMALQNHPAMKSASLDIEKQNVLKKTSFDVNKTKFQYATGQINSSVVDYQFVVSQQFKFPTTYMAQSKLQKQKILLSESQKNITQNELKREVKGVFAQLSYSLDQLELMDKLVKQYGSFVESAQKRFDVGETNILELSSAKAKKQEVLLKQQQVKADVEIFRTYLQKLMGSENVSNIEKVKKIEIDIGSNSVANNPVLAYYKQQIKVNESQVKVSKSAYTPDLFASYINQQIEGVQGMQAVRVGISIPLFFGANKGKVQASKVSTEIAKANLEQSQMQLDIALNQKIQQLEKAKATVNYYETQGLKLANQLNESSEKAYFQGEIGYIEYINNLQQASTIQEKYLLSLNEYNQQVIEVSYLMNNN